MIEMNMDDAYVQEEEWEREGLLDPAWEKQQRKVSAECATHICAECVLERGPIVQNTPVYVWNANKPHSHRAE